MLATNQSSMRAQNVENGDSRGRGANPFAVFLSAGLGMMSGNSRFPLVNIGRGGLEGLRTFSAANNRASQLEEREAEQADTGAYRKANLDLEVKKFSDSAKQHQDYLKFQADKAAQQAQQAKDTLAETTRYHTGELGIRGREADINQQKADQDRYQWRPGLGADPNDTTKQVPGSYRYSTRDPDAQPVFYPGVVQTSRTGGSPTAVQAAQNAEIDAARSTLKSIGVGRDDLLRRTQRQINGRDNPDFDPTLAAVMGKAARRKVSVDDPEFEGTWNSVHGGAGAATGSPGAANGAPGGGAQGQYLGDDVLHDGRRARIYQRPDGSHYAVPLE